MDEQKDISHDLIRSHLKILLLHLAAKSENPGYDLQGILREVVEELHQEVKEALNRKPKLRLIGLSDTAL